MVSFEMNPDVLWLRSLNPWSPAAGRRLELEEGDVTQRIRGLAERLVRRRAARPAALRNCRRSVLAGVLRAARAGPEARGKLFHYTGSPNRLTTGRDVPREVARRLQVAGFTTTLEGDGVLAVRIP